MEDLHISRTPSHICEKRGRDIPSCGHLFHRTCYNDLLRAGHYSCPVCRTEIVPKESFVEV